ncbi:MAG TPA: hypothetical protein VL793_10485 [Patescibacteria group bacterium]|nr:hypothetical protein [Patescibacteria group bacterium]
MKGSVKLHGRIDRIDPDNSALSPEARQPITFEIGLAFRQLDDKRKQVSLDVTGAFGETIFHTGMETPAFQNPDELTTARMSFTPQQAPSLNLPLRPLIERMRVYLDPELLKPLDKIDMSANPQVVLTTRKLEINAPGETPGELQSRWECSLGLHNLQDRAQDGKNILPQKTDFDFDLLINPAYVLEQLPPPPPKPGDKEPKKGGMKLSALRIADCAVNLNHKYCTVEYHLNTSDLLSLSSSVQTKDGPVSVVNKLPNRLFEKGQIKIQKEAYQLARELIKDKIILLPLTKDQQALVVTFGQDWDVADPAQHDSLALHVESQVDPFFADNGGKPTNLTVDFKASGIFSRIKLPIDPQTFDAVDFLFKTNASLDIATPLSVDQLILLLHQNALTLHIQDEIVNTINSPLSPISAGGKVQSEIHVQFDGQGTANLTIRSDLTDLYLQAKNEDPLHVLTLVKEKAKIPLLLHETRAQNPQTLPISLALVATAKREGNGITVRLDEKENVQHLGPLTLTLGTTLTMALEGPTVHLQKADYTKEMVLDCSQIAGLAPLATDLHLNGRLHVKSGAQGLDLGKLLAAPAPVPAAPPVAVAVAPAVVPAPAPVPVPTPAPAPAAPVVTGPPPPPPPLFDPNLNNASYEVFTAPDLTIEPKPIPATGIAAVTNVATGAAPEKYKLSLGIKNLSGDLGGNKTGEIIFGLQGAHATALHLADLRAIAKPEQRSFMQAVSSLYLRANARVFNTEDQPIYLLELTGAVQACTRAIGLPDPPPAPATPPPAGAPLQPGALDFIQPLTANLDLDLHHLIYDHYEVDAMKGKMLIDQGQFQMTEPLTASIYKGTAKVDVLVNLVGPHPDIPKILVDVTKLDYNDFFTRAYASPNAVAGVMDVHIEGTGKSALAPDIDSLNLKVITTQSEKTEITDVTKLPLLGALYTAAAGAFPAVLPANPGKIPLGTQTLKNGKLENGYFIFSEFPFHPTEGPLFGYDLVAEGRIHVMDATADPVTFKVTAIPPKVMDSVVATARKDLLVSANKGIPEKYQLTDADLDDADKDMRVKFKQFIADGHLYVRGRGSLSHPTPEMTSAREISDLLLKVGMGVMKKKIESILKKVAEDKAKEGLGNLLGGNKKK